MTSPYFNTILHADVRIYPLKMDNNILEHIKEELIEKYNKRCFKSYGYIDRIYDLDTSDGDNIKGGLIRAEDSTSSSLHRVKFKCRICNPIKMTNIMAKITGINNTIIIADAGPIKFMIGADNINQNNIRYMKSAFYPINNKGKIIDRPITEGNTYVMVKVMNKKIVNRAKQIIAFGRMESVVMDEDVPNAIKAIYNNQQDIEANDILELDKKQMEALVENVDSDEVESEESDIESSDPEED